MANGVFEPRDPNYEQKVRDSFNRQTAMHTLGGRIVSIEPGHVVLEMAFNQDFMQQHGFIHAGTITTMMDSAAGYAAFTLMSPEAAVLTIEFKTSLLAPAIGEQFRFEGRVTKPGRTITFCEADAIAVDADGAEKKVAIMTATMMSVTGRDDISS
ncbi:MAG: PaaI family thioesterase [Rhizobiaceae bacterium]